MYLENTQAAISAVVEPLLLFLMWCATYITYYWVTAVGLIPTLTHGYDMDHETFFISKSKTAAGIFVTLYFEVYCEMFVMSIRRYRTLQYQYTLTSCGGGRSASFPFTLVGQTWGPSHAALICHQRQGLGETRKIVVKTSNICFESPGNTTYCSSS